VRDPIVHHEWNESGLHRRYRAGVSIHSHTRHSHEDLRLVRRHALRLPLVAPVIRRELERLRTLHGRDLDVSRIVWTPPLTASGAERCERGAIERDLGLAGLVSLSDHDAIVAPLEMRGSEAGREVPVSFEWSVTYEETVFHLGIHNLPPARAVELFEWLRSCPDRSGLAARLRTLDREPDVLVVLNHPMWNQSLVPIERHHDLLRSFVGRYIRWIHALELNGLRTWEENRRTLRLAREVGRPAVGGGDRHGCEPGATINVTRARTFAEFVDEVRDGWSAVLLRRHYREPLLVRHIRTVWDVMRDHPNHPLGQVHWEQRLLVRNDAGEMHPLIESVDGIGRERGTRLFLGTVRLAQEPRLGPLLWPMRLAGELA